MTAPDDGAVEPAADDRAAPGRADRVPRHSAARPVRGRWAAIVVVAAAIVVMAVVDVAFPASSAPPPPGSADAVPVAAPGSYSSSAFCASGTGTAAATTIYLTNTTAQPVSGVMTAVGSAGGKDAVPVTHRAVSVPALGSAAINPAEGLGAGSSAAMFTFAGGGIAASQVVSGLDGWSRAPCASATSSQWTYAGGSTAGGNLLTLSLLNPTAVSSVVNISFLTDAGVIDPQAYQGLTVAPGQLVDENVGDYVQNAGDIATVVTAQSGTLVSTEFQQWSPGATGGLSLRLGSPALASTWRFAQTTTAPGETVDFYLANPGDAPVAATVSFGLSSGSVEPQQAAVAPRSVAVVAASAISGLPHQVPYSVTVSANEPIAVGRSVLAPAGSTAPVWGSSPGTVATSTQWVVPGPGVPGAPGTSGATVHSLAVADPGSSPVTVSISRLGVHDPFSTFTLVPGGLSTLGSNQVGGLATFLVSSSGPVFVEEDSTPSGAPGVVSSTGFPLSG